MFVHGFLLHWKQSVSAEFIQEVSDDLHAFHGAIPGLQTVHVGENISPRSGGYHFACVMFFEDQSALDAYFPHPQHQKFVAKVAPFAEAIDFDFQS